ncbi:S1/P1 nuclease [Maricaulis maris]|uniref:S1/P1 nuclease n=1 Tax=Maricaulis maris TaxID=74318 RepID=A0A495DDI4_9PROT|nr:S1/P1 nuclease [Maricaulis maris]RKR00323.1 S1/P1 nuclease [Maricaulis maris]
MSVFLRTLAAASLLITLVPTASVEAYGRDGHRIVCDLAYRYLSDETRAEVDRLVALDTQFDHFRDVCSWADEVRGSTHRHTAPWHYINQTRNDPHVDPEDCAEGGCITSAIDLHAGIFADRARADAERLEALKFLAHWMGDIHQPLHVSIEGDRGGNDINVLWRGERHTNLHRVWDSEILLDYMAETWPYLAEEDRWQPLVEELAADIPLTGVDVYAPLAPIAWAQESHDIVRSRGFAYYWANAEQTIEPGDAYYERNLPVSMQQLKQGGVRLAGLLNQLVEERQVSGRTAPAAVSGALN